MDYRVFLVAMGGVFGSALLIVWMITRTVLRMKQPQTPPQLADLEARLGRIESAVESISIEVERNGELQRFNARLAAGDTSAARPKLERPITPH